MTFILRRRRALTRNAGYSAMMREPGDFILKI